MFRFEIKRKRNERRMKKKKKNITQTTTMSTKAMSDNDVFSLSIIFHKP